MTQPISDSFCENSAPSSPYSFERDDPFDWSILEKWVTVRRDLKKGEHLYHMGDRLAAISVIRSGSVKTCLYTRDGRLQVTGFHAQGECLGLDALSDNRHPCDAIALETTEIWRLQVHRLQEFIRRVPMAQHQFLRLMSREIMRKERLQLMLGHLNAEARVASCLLNIGQRHRDPGQQMDKINLAMSRQDLADYLGLSLETVSRLFSRFQGQGLLSQQGHRVHLLDIPRLGDLVRLSSHNG